jgi:hypothetical protein
MKGSTIGLAIAAILLGAGQTQAATIAECGFNDDAGINADGVPNSPYQAYATTLGRGAGEPSWTGTWTGWPDSANFQAQPDVVMEGDLALSVSYTPGGPSTMREYVDQTGTFYVDFFLLANDLGTGAALIYTGEDSFDAHNVATNVSFQPDTSITLNDGGSWESTGFSWVPGQWTRVTERIDVPNQTYRLWINGQEYLAPDPIDFRHATATLVDDIRFLHSITGGDDFYVDAIRILDSDPFIIPEPSTLLIWSLLAGLGIGVGWRKRK